MCCFSNPALFAVGSRVGWQAGLEGKGDCQSHPKSPKGALEWRRCLLPPQLQRSQTTDAEGPRRSSPRARIGTATPESLGVYSKIVVSAERIGGPFFLEQGELT